MASFHTGFSFFTETEICVPIAVADQCLGRSASELASGHSTSKVDLQERLAVRI
jgi:hypothetical protein